MWKRQTDARFGGSIPYDCGGARACSHIAWLPEMISTDGTLTGCENLLPSAQLYNIPRRELLECQLRDLRSLIICGQGMATVIKRTQSSSASAA